jgi:plasmid stabilization system protein ParE
VKRLTVFIAPTAEDQIIAQVLHIAADSIDNALAWEQRLRRALENIGDVPSGHPIDEDASDRLGHTVRKAVFEQTYLLHFTVDEAAGVVRIVNFRHGARLPRGIEP